MAHESVEPPKYIDASRVKEVLKYEDLIPVIEQALVNFSARESGGIVQPVRSAVQMEDRGYIKAFSPPFPFPLIIFDFPNRQNREYPFFYLALVLPIFNLQVTEDRSKWVCVVWWGGGGGGGGGEGRRLEGVGVGEGERPAEE